MHPDPYSKELKEQQRSFEELEYSDTWYTAITSLRAIKNSQLDIKIDEQAKEIKRLENLTKLQSMALDRLKKELNTPWYRKLLNKLPIIKLTIKRRT